jgi:hypothetical protein
LGLKYPIPVAPPPPPRPRPRPTPCSEYEEDAFASTSHDVHTLMWERTACTSMELAVRLEQQARASFNMSARFNCMERQVRSESGGSHVRHVRQEIPEKC